MTDVFASNTAQLAKRDIFIKNGKESRNVLGDSRKRNCCPWIELGKYWPGKKPIRLQDSLPCPLLPFLQMLFIAFHHMSISRRVRHFFNRSFFLRKASATMFSRAVEWWSKLLSEKDSLSFQQLRSIRREMDNLHQISSNSWFIFSNVPTEKFPTECRE